MAAALELASSPTTLVTSSVPPHIWGSPDELKPFRGCRQWLENHHILRGFSDTELPRASPDYHLPFNLYDIKSVGTKFMSTRPRFCSAGVGFLPCLLTFKMASIDIPRQYSIRQKDEQLLATLGYKQEFRRAFTPLEVIDFWLRYPKIWLICGRSLVSPSLSLDYCPPLLQSFSMPSQMAEAQRWCGG